MHLHLICCDTHTHPTPKLLQTTLVSQKHRKNMARPKNDGKGRIGGRQKGTPNKSTSEIREIIARHWQQYETSGQFAADLAELDPAERVALMEKYASYIVPKMKSVDLDVTQQVRLTIEDRLRLLCAETKQDKNQTETEPSPN